MKVLTITENNIKEVYGRLKKFFFNKNSTGFEEWHNFDCGFKKHISTEIFIGNKRIRNIRQYPSPDHIRFDDIGSGYIILNLTATDSSGLQCGDKIAFCGNRIIFRTKCFWGDHKYIYSVFQVFPMSKAAQDNKRICAERDAAMYEAYYYADYCGL